MSRSSFRRIATASAVLGAAALIAPAVAVAAPGSGSAGSAGSEGTSCSTLSTEADPAGWGVPFDDEKNQKATYTDQTVLDDDGALSLAVATSSDRQAWYHAAGAEPETVKLADVIDKTIGFAEKADVSHASFQIRLLGTTGGKFSNGFTTLVWVGSQNDAADTVDGVVHTDLQNGQWWSTQDIDGAKDKTPVTLKAIAEANPDATVEHYGISLGSGSTDVSTLVDGITFNDCTTNFAKTAPKPDSGFGSLGDLFGSSS